MKNFLYWVIAIGFFAVLVFALFKKQDVVVEKDKYVKIGEVVLKTDTAETREEREQGLSGRTELKEDESLLFIFDYSGIYSFWMKDMNFPIDMIWIGENGEIVYIKKNAEPSSYPEAFTPTGNAKYVLETVSGFADKNNIKVGDKVEFDL